MSATIFTDGNFQGIDNNGLVVPYGKLYITNSQSGLNVTTYQDSLATITNTAPIILSASGKAKVFLTTGTYNINLKDASDVVIWTLNNFSIDGVDTNIKVINTVTDLRLTINSGVKIQTLGSASIGDGNSSLYYWDALSVLADDGVLVVQVTGVATGRWISVTYRPNYYIHNSTSKTTPVDADEIPLADSADTFNLKKLTWDNLKTTLSSLWGIGTPTGISIVSDWNNATNSGFYTALQNLTNSPTTEAVNWSCLTLSGINVNNVTQLAVSRTTNKIYSRNRNASIWGSWEKVVFESQAGLVQTQYAELTTSGTTTAFIPADDTIPQITEGVEILTVSITPKFATSRLLISVVSNLMEDTNVTNLPMVAALFRDSTADAFWASVQDFINSGGLSGSSFVGNIVIPAGSTSATTFRLRMGIGNTATGTTRWNGYNTARKLGGAQKITLMVQEIV